MEKLVNNYPADARGNGTQGKVVISVVVTQSGEIIDEKIEVGIGSGCDQVALEGVKNIPNEWVIGFLNGEPINVQIFIPVVFKLN